MGSELWSGSSWTVQHSVLVLPAKNNKNDCTRTKKKARSHSSSVISFGFLRSLVHTDNTVACRGSDGTGRGASTVYVTYGKRDGQTIYLFAGPLLGACVSFYAPILASLLRRAMACRKSSSSSLSRTMTPCSRIGCFRTENFQWTVTPWHTPPLPCH